MKILVTGGAGMIGSNLIRRLAGQGHEVFVADNFWRGKREYLLGEDARPLVPAERLFEVDLRDHDACLRATRGMDAVFHLADIVAGINFVFANQLFLWRANVLINSNVLDACVANKVGRYVYVGTACSFPKSKQSYLNPPPFREQDVYPAEPESAYGWSKLMGEYEAELAGQEGRLEVGILRLHNVYGPPCELDPEKSQVIPALCRKAILHPAEPFVVWGSGNQRRAFVHVDDIVDALEAVLDRGMNQGAIQIGPSESVSIREIAEKVVALSGRDIAIQYDATRPEGDMDRTADWSKAARVLGWAPRVDIDRGLAATSAWCARHLGRG
jgi:nucleoside-diphosphate-sugar epimerase